MRQRVSKGIETALTKPGKRIASGKLKHRLKIERMLGKFGRASVNDLYQSRVVEEGNPLQLRWNFD